MKHSIYLSLLVLFLSLEGGLAQGELAVDVASDCNSVQLWTSQETDFSSSYILQTSTNLIDWQNEGDFIFGNGVQLAWELQLNQSRRSGS